MAVATKRWTAIFILDQQASLPPTYTTIYGRIFRL